jgi:hypothetical protein
MHASNLLCRHNKTRRKSKARQIIMFRKTWQVRLVNYDDRSLGDSGDEGLDPMESKGTPRITKTKR